MVLATMTYKNIGFLNFGHWQRGYGSQVPTAADTLLQTIELAQAAEEVGADGAYVRVHHFANMLASPFPLLAAMGAKTSRIELGTGVIDMRYENPLYMAEDAAAADLISGGRLQLGVSRGSPETAIKGYEMFGYRDVEDQPEGYMARQKTEVFRQAIRGAGIARANPQMTGSDGRLAIQPQSPGLDQRIWWGAGTRATAQWAGEQGYNLMSSTLLTEATGGTFHELQREQIDLFREAWKEAGHEWLPRVSVSRSIFPLVSDQDRRYFAASREEEDQIGIIDDRRSTFGKTYVGEPEELAQQLANDSAIEAADTLLLTIPNTLGVEYNTHILESIVKDVAPLLDWR